MSNQKLFNVAVVGATGAVGEQIIRLLEERNFPIAQLKLLSSARSAGKQLRFNGKDITVEEATPESFWGLILRYSVRVLKLARCWRRTRLPAAQFV